MLASSISDEEHEIENRGGYSVTQKRLADRYVKHKKEGKNHKLQLHSKSSHRFRKTRKDYYARGLGEGGEIWTSGN